MLKFIGFMLMIINLFTGFHGKIDPISILTGGF